MRLGRGSRPALASLGKQAVRLAGLPNNLLKLPQQLLRLRPLLGRVVGLEHAPRGSAHPGKGAVAAVATGRGPLGNGRNVTLSKYGSLKQFANASVLFIMSEKRMNPLSQGGQGCT